MKLITFKTANFRSDTEERYRIGALSEPGEIVDLTNLKSKDTLTATELLGCFDLESGFIENAQRALDSGVSQPAVGKKDVQIVSPVPRPGKIICIGLNYRDHAEESGMAIP